MIETLKNFHNLADRARAKVTEATAEVTDAVRHIEVLTAALLDEEKAKLEAWLKDRQIK